MEVDRRKIKERITRLKREIEKVRRVRELHRQGRRSFSRSSIALVGYTNAGKSTLLNYLSHTGVLVENRLFSTLDPKIGTISLPNNQDVFISDTVGFINKLPHQLIAAFKATFEEAKESDILLHVIDISSPHFEAHITAVNRTLEEIGMPQKIIIHVLNKIDSVPHEKMISAWARKLENGVAISASTGKTGGELYFVKPGDDSSEARLPKYDKKSQGAFTSEILGGMVTEEVRKVLMPTSKEEKVVNNLAYNATAEERFSKEDY